jgi:hypothetical protein
MFLALMVGALGSPSSPSRGSIVDISRVDGGRSRISVTASQRAHCQHFLCSWWAPADLQHRLLRGPPSTFLASMVGALRFPTSPPKGTAIDISCIDVGRSQISSIAF